MIKLYQILLSRDACNRVNRGEHVPEHAAYSRASFDGEFPGSAHYRHVADLNAYHLDEAYEVGNIGPAGKITRHLSMRSVSVGDVLVQADGSAHMVAPCGFEPVDFAEQVPS